MSRRRTAAALMVIGASLVACGHPSASGLRVKGYAADLVFGAKTRPALVPRGAAPGPTVPVDTSNLQLPAAVAPRVRPPAVRKPCPDAVPGAAAQDAATVVVPDGRRPEVGRSRWKRTGSQTVTVGTVQGGAKIDIGGFEERVLRDVRELGGGNFAYQTVNTDFIGRSTYVTTWQVKPNATQEHVGELTAAVAVGDPERGLVIKAIDNFDNTGAMTGSYRPATGLLVLPLPVVPGEQFVSIAIDPQTGQVAEYQAQVVNRDRVDACGDFVEGWRVNGTLTFSSTDPTTPSQPQQYDLLVAPQFGAMVVSEHVTGQNQVGPFDTTFSLGQLHPAPL